MPAPNAMPSTMYLQDRGTVISGKERLWNCWMEIHLWVSTNIQRRGSSCGAGWVLSPFNVAAPNTSASTHKGTRDTKGAEEVTRHAVQPPPPRTSHTAVVAWRGARRMAQEGGEHDKRVASSPYVSSVDRQSSGGSYGDRPPKRSEVASGAGVTAAAAAVAGVAPVGGTGGSNDRLLMKRTLVAQSKKIQQLAAKIDVMETERGAMRQQVSVTTAVSLQLLLPHDSSSSSNNSSHNRVSPKHYLVLRKEYTAVEQ